MTQYLPPNLLALFAPRDPIRYLPPAQKLVIEKKTDGYEGVGRYLGFFEDPKETPPPTRGETKAERIERKRREKAEIASNRVEAQRAEWDASTNPAATGDAFKTLFVGRINYDTSESKLRREFEHYGPIRSINMVHCKKTGKPRGYAFIEYEHDRDMHDAYKHADGKKIDSRRVLVDVERARTVKGWFPRRLGGGLGGTRRGAPDQNTRHSGREDPSGSIGREDDRRERPRREERRRRSRSRSKEPRRRERDRGDRDNRDRRRDRDSRRDRGADRGGDRGGDRDRDRERRRKDRSRDRDRDYRDRGHDIDEDRKPTTEELEEYERGMRIKEEKQDDYPELPPKEEPQDFEVGQLVDGQTNGQTEEAK
ncbi:U1 small nuclear ribonucleoprotein 70 kDa-like [Apostichopus japonicus]|uniref:U1 small nuclear ribonucleoprotein 70 kDa-like n=1 Tax=Stichopus japonicus TaxID=307972 RepID=UPI003AB5B36B